MSKIKKSKNEINTENNTYRKVRRSPKKVLLYRILIFVILLLVVLMYYKVR
ncbi:MAG: hypothetical protein K6E56_06795 [Lachnospiraceae bacterium]|nr:hypothetical protein [Lachnospiraceae bacterium]